MLCFPLISFSEREGCEGRENKLCPESSLVQLVQQSADFKAVPCSTSAAASAQGWATGKEVAMPGLCQEPRGQRCSSDEPRAR